MSTIQETIEFQKKHGDIKKLAAALDESGHVVAKVVLQTMDDMLDMTGFDDDYPERIFTLSEFLRNYEDACKYITKAAAKS